MQLAIFNATPSTKTVSLLTLCLPESPIIKNENITPSQFKPSNAAPGVRSLWPCRTLQDPENGKLPKYVNP